MSILGLTLLNPSLTAAGTVRNLGIVKKKRSNPFQPTPKEECSVLGEKKQITYFIESKEGCTKPSDKANLIGPSITSYIEDLSSKWLSTDFIAVDDKDSADFVIILGNDRNADQCPTTSYWSSGRKEMALGDIGSYGLTKRKQKRRMMLHEFGHVLGLSHEHTHPDFPYTLDLDAIAADSSNPGIHNYLPTTAEKSYLSKYDIKSIMHYKLEKKETKEDKRFKLNYLLTDGDHIAEFIAMPPCGLTSDEAYDIYVNLDKELSEVGESVTPGLFCEELFANLGVDSTGRCEFPKDKYLVLSNYAIIGMSAAGVLVVWMAKRACCGDCPKKTSKQAEQPTEPGEEMV
ncbi:MAG: hypothetical protein HRU09_20150 [Oligoflexales bacterium]|nr:hypothetical protein [Oligoflexales bacterium]